MVGVLGESWLVVNEMLYDLETFNMESPGIDKLFMRLVVALRYFSSLERLYCEDGRSKLRR